MGSIIMRDAKGRPAPFQETATSEAYDRPTVPYPPYMRTLVRKPLFGKSMLRIAAELAKKAGV
jgi:hypothetical protein